MKNFDTHPSPLADGALEVAAGTESVKGDSTRPVPVRWIGLFGLAWLGMWLAQLTVFQLVLPQQVNDSIGIGDALRLDNWRSSVTDFGVISGISAVSSTVAFPAAGALSDRTTSRFGRRRSWIMGGCLLLAGSLAGLSTQTSIAGITVCWSLAMIGFSAASAALTALIGDQVPRSQRGVVSSWISTPQGLAPVLGVSLVAFFALNVAQSYWLVVCLLLALMVPFVLTTPDPAVSAVARARWSAMHLLGDHDFRWTLIGRVLVNLGNALGTALTLYYLQFGLKVADAEESMVVLSVSYMGAAIAASIFSGWCSDRLQRRKPFVLVAAIMQAISAAVILCLGNLWGATIAAAVLGAGYGSFMAIDQALAADVLPDAGHNGQELGIMNIAMAIPQALGPLVGAGLIAAGGFPLLWIGAAALTVLGGASVMAVARVR